MSTFLTVLGVLAGFVWGCIYLLWTEAIALSNADKRKVSNTVHRNRSVIFLALPLVLQMIVLRLMRWSDSLAIGFASGSIATTVLGGILIKKHQTLRGEIRTQLRIGRK